MSRWEASSLRADLVVDVGRGVTRSIRAVASHAVGRGMSVLNRFVELRAQIFARQLRDVGNTR